MKRKYKDLLVNILIFGVGLVLSKAVNIFLLPLYTSYLSTDQFGISELINSVIQVILPVLTLAIIEALYRFVLDKDTSKVSLYTNSLLVIISSSLLLVLIIGIMKIFYSWEYYLLFFLLYISQVLFVFTSSFSRALGHNKRFVFASVANALILVLCNYVFIVRMDMDINGYLLSIIISYTISAVILFFLSRQHRYIRIQEFNKPLLKLMIIFSLPQVINAISWWINGLSSRYLILGYLGAATAGIYIVASKLPSLMMLFSEIFQRAWQFSSYKESNEESKTDFYSNVYDVFLLFGLAVTSIFIVLVPFLAVILIKGDFTDALSYIPPLIAVAFINALTTFFGTIFMALKINKLSMYSTLIGSVINILLTIVLLPTMGLFGVIVASLSTYLVILIIRIFLIKPHIHLKINYAVTFGSLLVVLGQSFLSIVYSTYNIHIFLLSTFLLILINITTIRHAIKFLYTSYIQRRRI